MGRAAPPGDSSEYWALAPVKGVRREFGGGGDARAPRLGRVVESSGGGGARRERSEAESRADAERCRDSRGIFSPQ